ncbi:unnamed protein product [Ceratitis capitata]|uniref:(Mediterranean fruit fly) hypothetical protein n=1 Tax=Ceratitis capitata TaxID=7213 RepID=A0A811U5G0_CERCA|nr:unnamed protein product [Ceratitis capitata]
MNFPSSTSSYQFNLAHQVYHNNSSNNQVYPSAPVPLTEEKFEQEKFLQYQSSRISERTVSFLLAFRVNKSFCT